MKKYLNTWLATALILNPLAAFAQEKPLLPADQPISVSVEAKDFKKQFEEVVFSLETLPQVVQSLDYDAKAASHAISKGVAAKVYDRLSAAVELMSAIITDEKMTQDQKMDYIEPLAGKIGELFFLVIRHHGEDQLKPAEELKFDSVAQSKAFVKELFLDARSLVKYAGNTSADGEKVWGPMDRIRRDRLAQQVTLKLSEYSHQVLPMMEEGAAIRVATQEFWKDAVAEKAIKIRQHRLGAQYATGAIYMGLGVVGLLFPLVDAVGLVDGRSEWSLFASSMIYLSAWLSVGLLKLASVSSKTLNLLEDWVKILKNPEAELAPRKSILERMGIKRAPGAKVSTGMSKDNVIEMGTVKREAIPGIRSPIPQLCRKAVGG